MSSTSSSSYETCNSKSLSWLLTPCIPKSPSTQLHFPTQTLKPEPESPISALPDDLLLTCLARAPLSSLPSLSVVSRRFSLLLSSPLFFPLRRSLSSPPLTPTLFSLSLSPTHLILAVHQPPSSTWRTSAIPLPFPLSHPSPIALHNSIYLLSRSSALKLDTWTARISPISPPLHPRKNFAAAALSGHIHLAGGSSRTSALEIYDPTTNTWRLSPSDSPSPSRRYGCVGAAVKDEAFIVAGGLAIGGDARAAHVMAGTLEVYDERQLRVTSARVPGGGCIVGACGVGPGVYVMESNAVEIRFWRWDVRGGKWEELVGPPVGGGVGVGGAVRFSCCAVGEERMACAVHVSGRGRGRGRIEMEGAVLVYDVGSGEWSRGPDLPVGFRRAGLVCVEC